MFWQKIRGFGFWLFSALTILGLLQALGYASGLGGNNSLTDKLLIANVELVVCIVFVYVLIHPMWQYISCTDEQSMQINKETNICRWMIVGSLLLIFGIPLFIPLPSFVAVLLTIIWIFLLAGGLLWDIRVQNKVTHQPFRPAS